MLATYRTMPTSPDQTPVDGSSGGRQNPERFFADDRGDLARRSARSGFAVLGGQAGAFLATLLVTPIIARLLTPEDFGLVAMVTAVTAFMLAWRDLGLTQATAQRAGITHGQVSNLFWVNAAFGLVGGGIIAALAVPLADFYGEPRVTPITLALAGAMPIAALGAQHQALLQRRLELHKLAVVRLVSVVGAAAAMVTIALLTRSFWALVAGEIVAVLLLTAGCWLACGWRPGLPRRGEAIGGLLRYGAFVSLTSIVGTAQRNADKVVVGRAFGDAALGAYNRAFAVLILPITQLIRPLTQVALPTLAKLQDEPDRFRVFYRRGLGTVSLIGLPFVALVFVAAEPIVLLMLGEQWTKPGQDAVTLTRALSPVMIGGVLSVATAWPYLALGRTGRQFAWQCASVSVQIAGVIVAAGYSAVAVAATMSAMAVLLRVPAVLYCFRGTFLRFCDFAAPVWRPVVACVGSGAAVFYLDGALGVDAGGPAVEAVRLLAMCGGLTLAYTLLIAVLPGGLAELKDTASLLRHLKKKRDDAADQPAE